MDYHLTTVCRVVTILCVTAGLLPQCQHRGTEMIDEMKCGGIETEVEGVEEKKRGSNSERAANQRI